jgi:hypothetical protein
MTSGPYLTLGGALSCAKSQKLFRSAAGTGTAHSYRQGAPSEAAALVSARAPL